MAEPPDFTPQLRQWMQRCSIPHFAALARISGISEKSLRRLRRGEIGGFRLGTLDHLAGVLQISRSQLLSGLEPSGASAVAECVAPSSQAGETTPALMPRQIASEALGEDAHHPASPAPDLASLAAPDSGWPAEYARLQQQMEQQRHQLWQEFQQASLQILEPLILQWPTAAHAASQNPQLPAAKLLPLLRPIDQLLQVWQIEAIAPVGTQVAYDPQVHQLLEGTAHPGDLVQVRYTGYRQDEQLLYRAKVSPVKAIATPGSL